MAWSVNGQMLLSGDHEGIIKYFNASMTNVKNIPDAHGSAVRGLSFAPSESKYVSCRYGILSISFIYFILFIYLFHLFYNKILLLLNYYYMIVFILYSDDSSVKIWDWEKGIPDVVYSDNEHLSDVKCAEWHPFRSLIATGSKDNTVKLWDPRESRSLRY